MVFWILLWSKSHGEQFSQVERSASINENKICTKKIDRIFKKINTLSPS